MPKGVAVVYGDSVGSPDSRAYLRRLAVTGFRGIGPTAELPLEPGPGLTLVVGRNGSGKSSFAEGLEILLTGSNWRWAKRSKVWREGWRNLHDAAKTEVAAELLVEGRPAPVHVTRSWTSGVDLEKGQLAARVAGGKALDLGDLGWTDAIETYRPILSYNELGAMFEGKPTDFHDALSAMLGLGEYDDLARQAADERRALEQGLKQVTVRLPPLIARLQALGDERADAAAAALSKRKAPDLDAAERALGGAAKADADVSDLQLLRSLASVEPPSDDEVLDVAGSLRSLVERSVALAGTPAGRAVELARLLRSALAFHERHRGADCPVCGTAAVLDGDWRARAEQQAAELEALAAEAQDLESDTRRVLDRATRLLAPPPSVLGRAGEVGLESDARTLTTAWTVFATRPDGDLLALADHLEAMLDPVRSGAEALREAALAELERREGRWRPVARELAAWLAEARPAYAGRGRIDELKAEELTLKAEQARLKAERFAPIEQRAIGYWTLLRQASSVELDRIMLEGTGTTRRVTVDVSIDGVDGAALGVMSQGELHAIALSLFLPRATMPESPFRFIVIDDPVQSMDPARVDGLARVFEDVARERQVVVFTHDDRLREAVNRLGIAARVVEVVRREGSVVEVRKSLDPVRRSIEDARAIALDESLPALLGQQVVPGFCRTAIEAACTEVVRRRRLGRGESHAAVDELLASATTVTTFLALALFDEVSRGAEVAPKLRQWGDQFIDAWGAAKSGAHTGYRGPLLQLVKDTEQLCSRIRQIDK